MKKLSFPFIGFLQAIGVVAYVALVSGFMCLLNSVMIEPPEIIGMMMILLLLVFSAGLTGMLVFGYPIYLALQKQWKEALLVTLYTFLFLFLIGLLLIGSLFLFQF